MTDQRQSTGDQWAPPAPTMEQADPDWTEPESSTQDSMPRDLTGTETPAEDGTVYQSAAHESAVDEPVVEELPTDGNAVDEPVAEERIAAQPAGDGFVAVDGSVPADDADLDDADLDDADLDDADLDDADLDRADREHADSEHAVGMASVPDAEPATDTEAGIVDRGDSDSPGVDSQDAARTEGPDGAYGIEGHPADAQAVVEEQKPAEEPDGVAVVTDTGQPADGVDERADVADGEVPLVPVPVDDAAAPDVTDSGELLPGDVPEEPALALFDGETTERFRDRWQELQLRFVDDPHAAASLAGALVDEVVAALRDAVDRQRSALEDWQSGDGVDAHSEDTERLRVAVRRYRDFLDRLLGL
jgi:hypothetical protein